MDFIVSDFNESGRIIDQQYLVQWEELADAITGMPIHLKASDQKGIQGKAIFDVVGTNSHLKDQLVGRGWRANIPIPPELSFLGTDVDFAKNGVVAEVQFSNYPFLLNNLLRSELFFKERIAFAEKAQDIVVLITKGGMFPASNSTLYFEQAREQLTALAKFKVFDVPIRLVGLVANPGTNIPVVWSRYSATRYSREVAERINRTCEIKQSRKRCTVTLLD